MWADFNLKTGALTGTPTVSHIGAYQGIIISVNAGKGKKGKLAFSITVQNPNLAASPPTTPPKPPVPPEPPALSALIDEALRTGDASKLSIENLLNEGISQAQTENNYCTTELTKIYPNNLELATFPPRSAYMTSSSSRNIPLHMAETDGEIDVYSWLGTKASGTPYAVLGTNVFSFTNVNSQNVPLNQALKNSNFECVPLVIKAGC